MDDYSKSLLQMYGIDHDPDFSKLIKATISSFSFVPKDNSWDESHMLQEKMNGLDFAAVCVKVLNVDSRTSYELGLIKVQNWKVTDTFQSYINPVVPISKAMRKIIDPSLLAAIDDAPTLSEIWPSISHFFESNVLYGAEASTRRILYCLDSCGFDISPVALPRGYGSMPRNLKELISMGEQMDERPAVNYAMEWAVSRLKSRINGEY